MALACLLLILAAWPFRSAARAAVPNAPSWVRQSVGGTLPPARSQFGMSIDSQGVLYTYGGRGPDGATLADFWRLRPGGSWEHLPNSLIPALIEPHLATDAAGNVFEFGGIAEVQEQGHFSDDRHSYGLYEWVAARGQWVDLTPAAARPDVDWPLPREDHGFAFDPGTGLFFVFAGEGPGEQSLNDMWTYDEGHAAWRRVAQHSSMPGGVDAREIYNVSPDGHGGLYLFGGAYLFGPDHKRARWTYVNDLWRFDIATSTWLLVAGQANAYDPAMPLPRHYYGQACDAQGNFYILGGYVSDTASPAYFSSDDTSLYAQVTVFSLADTPTGNIMFALDDFWQWGAAQHQWTDLSAGIGDLHGSGFIPYVMVANPATAQLISFGGYHPNQDDEMQAGAQLYSYPLTRSSGPLTTATPLPPSTATPASTTRPTSTPAGVRRAPTATAIGSAASPTPTASPTGQLGCATAGPAASPTDTWSDSVASPTPRAGGSCRAGTATPLPWPTMR